MSNQKLEYHEVANIFPLMFGDDFERFKEDIDKNGLLEEIIIYDEKILDGRNRYKACIELNIEPKLVYYDGQDPVGLVLSLNLHRRQLTVSQLSIVAIGIEKIFKQFADERMKSGIKINPEDIYPQGYFPKNKAEQEDMAFHAMHECGESKDYVYFIQSVKGGDIKIGTSNYPPGRLKQIQTGNSELLRITKIIKGDKSKESELHRKFKEQRNTGEWFSPVQSLAEMANAIPGRAKQTSELAGDMVGISEYPIKAAKKIIKDNPDYEKKIKSGELTIEDVKRELKSIKDKVVIDNIEQQKDDIEAGELPILENKYHAISIDPPWPYELKYDDNGDPIKKESNYDSTDRRSANQYPEMSIKEITDIDLPAADDSILWLWTTHRFLPDAFEILKAWGYEYKATMVWNKKKMGMGYWLRMQCEFCLLAVKGKPFWDNTTERDIISVKGREHSRKPDEFFEMVNKTCHGAKLEYFSREPREGWDGFGNDMDKFDE